MRKLNLLTLAVAAIVSLITVREAAAVATETVVKEVAPGVFFRKAQTEPNLIGCNQGFIVFKDYVLVIDANFPGQAAEVIKFIPKYSEKPIRYVFDTHYHGDHADGNVQFAKIGAMVVATERSRPEFDTKGEAGFEASKKTKAAEYGELKYEKPGLYFEHKMVLDDGTQRVEFLWFGHGHTAGDAVAWLPKHGILFTGDACVNGPFNYLGDANTESWITILNRMDELPVKTVCPGHGEMAGKEVITTQRRYFVELRDAVKKGMEAGQQPDAIAEGLTMPWYKEWTGTEASKRKGDVEHVFGELGGKKAAVK